ARGAGSGGAPAAPPDVRIDWNGLARRITQLRVPGTTIGNLTPTPDGHSVALSVSTAPVGGGRGIAAASPDPAAGMYIVNVETGQLTRVPPAPPRASAQNGRGSGRGGPGGPLSGPSNLVFARDGRTLFFKSGEHMFVAAINPAAGAGSAGSSPVGGGRGAGR